MQVENRVVRYPSGKEVEWDVVGSSSNYFVTVLPFNAAKVRVVSSSCLCVDQLGTPMWCAPQGTVTVIKEYCQARPSSYGRTQRTGYTL
jgi:hypothetical protein